MAPVAGPGQRSAAEVVEQLKRRLVGYFEAAEVASEKPRRVFDLAKYLVHARHELAHATQAFRNADDPQRERVMQQTEIAYFTYPERFSKISGRSDLLKEWTKLLLEATEKVVAEDEKRGAYVAASEDEKRDREGSPVAAASRAALDRWR